MAIHLIQFVVVGKISEAGKAGEPLCWEGCAWLNMGALVAISRVASS
ncbi:hypothetical protein NG726_04990 [Pseudomonas sp. MOB-449]|nr:hypothetical protein [Pseudomonas sp. MOB-449]